MPKNRLAEIASAPLLSNIPSESGLRAARNRGSFQDLRESASRRVVEASRQLQDIGQLVYVHRRAIAKRFFIGGIFAGIVTGVVVLITVLRVSPEAASVVCGVHTQDLKIVQHYSQQTNNLVGVNLGGWLCLEDWFFSGAVGRYVSTPGDLDGQGACLPPLVPGPLKSPWGSEGQLTAMLVEANYGRFQQGNKCLEVQHGAATNGNELFLSECSNSADQIFLFPDSGSTGPIQWKNKCLDVSNGKKKNGTKVQLWDCWFGSPNQHWHISDDGHTVKWDTYMDMCLTSNRIDVLMIWECGKTELEWWSGKSAQTFNIDYQVKGERRASEAFIGHRESFINNTDYEQISLLGVKSVRIPLGWQTFADVMADDAREVYGSYDPFHDTAIVPDPYYTDLKFATIPRHWLKRQIEAAASKGLRVVLDIHNMPGGSSEGTYSGVWPRQPKFWKYNMTVGGNGEPGSSQVPLRDIGLRIAKAAFSWVENHLTHLVKSGHIRGLCIMNEPGHLSAFGQWASGDMILEHVGAAADMFRHTSLPKQGVRLYIQLIETAWVGNEFNEIVAPWYHSTFTEDERYTWAVFARHHYTAWAGGFAGGKVYPGDAYTCDQELDSVRTILRNDLRTYAEDFARTFKGLRALTEWSLGTNPDADLACTNQDLLRVVFEENVMAWGLLGDENKIEPFFWSWRIPYGPKFQPGWSLKYFSGLAGIEPEVSNGRCVVGTWAKENPLNVQ